MRYHCGTEVLLDDIVSTPVPDGRELARVVMLGENYNHLDMDADFTDWVKKERILKSDCVVIEWLNRNPFAHNDPRYAPVGNFMFVGVDEDLDFQQRAKIINA